MARSATLHRTNVLKPVDENRLRDTGGRVRRRVRQDGAVVAPDGARGDALHIAQGPAPYLSRFLVRAGQKVMVVNVCDIDWIEADGDYLRLHAGAREYLHRATMSAVEGRLDPAEWVRVHRGAIVRLSRVKELEPYFHGDYAMTLVDGTQLRLSRTYRARFQSAFGQRM